jgi:FMN phosphatase YigB (HAD superfamily)
MKIKAVIFDYGNTVSSAYYFNVKHPDITNWFDLIQSEIFGDDEFMSRWISGKAKLTNVAGILHEKTNIDEFEILQYLKDGCKKLMENTAVKNFAESLKEKSIPIALVSGNFDVFSEVVVPYHGYDSLFDCIINTSDYGETDKQKLWPIAFARIGTAIHYGNSLLIEDNIKEIKNFRNKGGYAIQYIDDDQLLPWQLNIPHL